MYNQFLYNSILYNGNTNQFSGLDAQDDIVFNGFSMQNSNIIVRQLLQDSTPERDLQVNAIPRGDGQYIIGDYWRRKIITMKGTIKTATNSQMEALIDEMKKALAVREAILDIKIDGQIRRYHATMVSGNTMFNNREHYHITFIPFEVSFVTVEPYGYSPEYEFTTIFNQTILNLQEEISNIGTISAKPIIILNVIDAVNVTAVSFINNTRGEEVELIKNINPGDYIVFDSEALEVRVNGTPQDYNGSFPLLNTDANSINVNVTGDSIEYTYTAKYLIPYL